MLWNFMMHALMGWLGAYYFVLTPERIGVAILVVCITQAVDQIRIRKEKWAEVEALPKQEQTSAKQALEKKINGMMTLIMIQNIMLFSIVLLLTAQIVRVQGWL